LVAKRQALHGDSIENAQYLISKACITRMKFNTSGSGVCYADTLGGQAYVFFLGWGGLLANAIFQEGRF